MGVKHYYKTVDRVRCDAFVTRCKKSKHAHRRGTIVFIHGCPDDYRIWDRYVKHYTKDCFDCIAIALPQFLKSQPKLGAWDRGLSTPNVVKSIREVIRASSRDKKVTLCLHDIGCIYGACLERLYPGMINRIVAMDVWPIKYSNFKYLKLGLIYQWISVLFYLCTLMPLVAQPVVEKAFHIYTSVHVLWPFYKPEHISIHSNFGYLNMLREFMGDSVEKQMQLVDYLPKHPMLFFTSKNSPHHSTKLISEINKKVDHKHPSRYVTLADCDHWIPQRNYREVVDIMDTWLREGCV